MAYSSENGAQSIYNFPDHNVDPKVKLQKEWNVQYCQAIYSLYRNNLTGINFSDVDLFNKFRTYGNGNQDPTQYMSRLGIEKSAVPIVPNQATSSANPTPQQTDFIRKGFMNINWEILSVAPNFKNVILGTFEDIEHDIYADGVDEKSGTEREQAKWMLWMEREMAGFVAEMNATVGTEIKQPEYIPETMQELQMFSDLGGFKLRSEIAIEEGIRYTVDISEWKEIKRKIFEDLFELGVAVAKDYLDPMTQKVKTRYADPALCILPFNPQQDFKSMPFAGEFTFYTIAELRAMNNVDGTPTFTNEELEGIAKCSLNQFNNPAVFSNWSLDQYGRYAYDTFRICVLDCEFKSDDYKYTTERVNSKGETVVHRDEFGKVRTGDKRKTHITKTLMVYKCKWIVGTEYAWDFGHQFDIPRPTPSEANLSFHAYKMKSGSMIKRMIPLLDSIQLSWLKLQNAKAKARPSGLAIEMGSLTNISIGNNKLTPLDVLKITNQTGDVLFQATTHRTYMPSQTSYKPIQELQGGLGNQGVEFLNLIQNDIEMIRQIIGINNIADASSPSNGQLVGVAEMALSATSTTLKPMYSAYITIKERIMRNVALRIQLIVKYSGEYELSYHKALGAGITQTLKIGSEVNNAMFGIRIQARPDQQEKQAIIEAARESMQAGRNGVPLIGYGDYLMVVDFVSRGMTKWARAYIANKEAQTMKKMEEEKKMAIELQGQQQKELQQMNAEHEKAMADFEMAKIDKEGQIKMSLEEVKHKNKMEEIQLTMGMQQRMDAMNKVVELSHNRTQAELEHEQALELQENQAAIDKDLIKATPKPTTPKK